MTDPSADPRRFDPRFDPAFQPGYDPRNDPAAPARATPHRFDAAPPTTLTPPDRVPHTERATPARVSAPTHPVASVSVPDESDVDADLDTTDDAATDDAATARGVNPFAITLWVVSVVLIAAGITVFRSIPGLEQQGSFSTGPGTAVSFYQVFSLSVLGPILIGSGILIAAGNVFLLAVGWPRRRG